jgi:hypothetical protein
MGEAEYARAVAASSAPYHTFAVVPPEAFPLFLSNKTCVARQGLRGMGTPGGWGAAGPFVFLGRNAQAAAWRLGRTGAGRTCVALQGLVGYLGGAAGRSVVVGTVAGALEEQDARCSMPKVS